MTPMEFADGLVRGRLPALTGSELADMGREYQRILDDNASGILERLEEALLDAGRIATGDKYAPLAKLDEMAIALSDMRAALVDLGVLAPDDRATDMAALIRILFATLKS